MTSDQQTGTDRAVVRVQTIAGSPTDDEVAAVVAALQLVWPTARPVTTGPDRSTIWRTTQFA